MLVAMQIGKSHLKSALGGSIKDWIPKKIIMLDNKLLLYLIANIYSYYIRRVPKNIRGTFFLRNFLMYILEGGFPMAILPYIYDLHNACYRLTQVRL